MTSGSTTASSTPIRASDDTSEHVPERQCSNTVPESPDIQLSSQLTSNKAGAPDSWRFPCTLAITPLGADGLRQRTYVFVPRVRRGNPC